MAIIGSISAACPYKCTGTIAFVLEVIAFSMAFTSMQKVALSTSIKIGLIPKSAATSTVAI